MSATILRLGLWILVLVMALYVIHESYEEQPLAEMIPMQMLQHALVLSVVLVGVGLVVRMFEKTTRKVLSPKNRCRVCPTAIAPGAIYCRVHLRGMLEREDRRTHNTRIR
jgi:predicted nucleic acid-binding Zn ribbon protein